jgi:hypothetical protein
MDRSTIVEITSWDTDGREPGYYTALAELGAGGVVLKAAQGVGWTLPWLPAAIRGAKLAGLLVGVLSYAEPGLNDPQAEADHLLSSLPDDDLPLGLWLELDDLNGKPTFELGDWVKAWIEYAVTPSARPVIMATREVYDTINGSQWGRRWVQSDQAEGPTVPWAARVPSVRTTDDPVALLGQTHYRMTTTRGLNAPVAPGPVESTPKAAPKPPAKHQAPTGKHSAKAPESSHGEPVQVAE